MKGKMLFSSALYFILVSTAQSQEFPIGIWFGGNQNSLDAVSTMNFTWIQAYGGWDRNGVNNQILQNNRNLKVIAILDRNIYNPSYAQRMEYEAEQGVDGTGRFNYFATHQTGQRDPLDPTLWRARVSDHAAGWITKDPVPNNQYFYMRTNWVASATLRIDLTGNASAQVVRIEIANGATILAQRIITEGEFSGSTAFRTFELSYTLPTPLPSATSSKLPVACAQPIPNNTPIDVRVWWYDQVNTYLDEVVLEDFVSDPLNPHLSGAYQLFRGGRDADITNDASFFASQTTYPLLQRFYLRDEPYYNGYQPFNYVDQRILNTAGIQGSASGRGRGSTATPNYSQGSSNVNAAFNRFMDASDPYELFVDAYPIHADIPAPTSYIPAGDAANAGILAYTSSNDYNTRLQGTLDYMIVNGFLPAIQTANGSIPALPWWYIAQVHGELDFATGRYRRCDNSNPMLRLPSPEEIRTLVNLSLAYGAKGVFYFWFPSGGDVNFGGCAEVRFPGLVAFGTENTTPNHSSNYDTFNGRTVFTGYQRKYDEITAINSNLKKLAPILLTLNWQSAFTSGETAPAGSVVTSISGGASSFVEVGNFVHQTSGENYFMLVNRRCETSDVQTLTVTLTSSGSRRLIEDVLASYSPWDGNANRVAYRTLEAGINTVTTTLNPGEGRLFRVTSGLSGTLTANRCWSGAPYVIDNLTVNSGVTLTVERATTIKFASSKKLTINGSIQAIGTSSQGITFDRVASTGTWSGLWIENSTAVSNFDYCTSRNASFGIRIRTSSGNVTINHATLTNNSFGLQTEFSSPYTIDANCSNSTQAGVFCITNCDPFMRSTAPGPDYGNNYVRNNLGAGVKASNNSFPRLGIDFRQGTLKDYYGYNEIYGNGGAEIHNANTSGTIIAERNYWSADHNVAAIPSDLYGSVDYTPVLGGPPTGIAGKFPLSNTITSTIDFEAALALEMQDQLQAAADLYLKLLESDPNADNVGFGVSGLIRCYKGLDRRNDIVFLLDDFVLKFPNTTLAASAQDHSLPYLVNVGRVDDALARAVILLRQNRNVADKEPDYLFRLASLYLLKSQGNAGIDLTNALAFYQELIQKYATSDFAFFASLELEQLGVAGFAKPASETATALSEPQTFTLYPNHPNPFNPETRIKFYLQSEQRVVLRLYDVSGRLIKKLVDGVYQAGEHFVIWNGKNFSGVAVGSGVDFYELVAGDRSEHGKMTLLQSTSFVDRTLCLG